MRIKNILRLLGWGFAIFLVTVLANIGGRYFGSKSETNIQSNQLLAEKVVAVTLKQENPGLTEAMLDQGVLIELEEWVRQTLVEKTRAGITNQGADPDSANIDYNVESSYVLKGGRKLAMFKFSTSLDGSVFVNGVRLMCVDDDYLVSVSCIVEQPEPVFVWSGNCGREVEKELRVSMKRNP